MNDTAKTIAFACSGAAALLLAVGSYFWSRPAPSTGFELVGQEFFEDFQDSRRARSLEVYAVDSDSAKLKQFRVEEKQGVWSIPSHHGYPAEAADRLAQTCSSLIGLKRQALVGRLQSDHERFSVVDPLGDEVPDPEAIGKRITLKDEDGEVLVDLIIGRDAGISAAEERDLPFGQKPSQKNFYVRRPDEVQTYLVGMELDLSTRFSDWIRPNLLELDEAQLKRLEIDNFELVEQPDPLARVVRLYKQQGDQMRFRRDSGFGPWTMDDLNPETHTFNSSKVSAAVSTLENLKIVGVRKKTAYKDQPLLNPDLTLNQIDELKENIPLFRQIMERLQLELEEYGFNLTPVADQPEELTLIPTGGQLSAGTETGVVYTLLFGNPIRGDDNEIEIGSVEQKPRETNRATDQTYATNREPSEPADSIPNDDTDIEAQPPSDDLDAERSDDIRNRFLMIRVSLDESLIGERPLEPIKPEPPVKPEGYVSRQAASDQADQSDQDPAPSPDGPADENPMSDESEEENSVDGPDPRPLEFQDFDLAWIDYEQAKADYELKLTQFQNSLNAFDEKVLHGQQLVKELNERFGRWFYVISADNLQSLQLKREEIETPKETPGPSDGLQDDELPLRPNIRIDND